MQEIFTAEIIAKLAMNGEATRAAQVAGLDETPDHVPVVKVFNPYGGGTWLLTESDPDDWDILFGLCDLGHPELGCVRRSEIELIRIVIGGHALTLERDEHFQTDKPLSWFTAKARDEGHIAV